MQHGGYAGKTPAPIENKPTKKPTADRGVAADKRTMTLSKSRQRIEAAMNTLMHNNTIERLVMDLKEENKRLREENDQIRGISNAVKKELEDFRAIFHDYCYACIMPETPMVDETPAQSVNMDEN